MSKKELEIAKEKKTDLDEILFSLKEEGFTEDVSNYAALADKDIARIVSFDYMQIKKDAEKKSKKHVESIVRFYINEDAFDDEFLKIKMTSDMFRLAKQIVFLEVAEHSIAKLTQEIDQGTHNSRLWEVMASMMKSFDSMNITYAKLEILIENNYKTICEEIDYKKSMSGSAVKGLENQNVGGHKAMLSILKKSNEEKYISLEK